MPIKKISFLKSIGLACLIIVFVFTLYHINRDVFMSVEKMLSTGYALDPDYYGEIRGTSCGSCDDGVIQFEDSLTLIDLMYDEDNDEVMRDMAGWAFMNLQWHLLAQFAYGPDERAEFALKVLRHFQSKNPDKYALSGVYSALHFSKEDAFDWSDTAAKKLQEARSLFSSFCADIWGSEVRVNNYSNGKLALVSTTMQEPLFTKNDWELHKYIISRRIEEENIRSWKFPKFEVIPISCFANKEEIYDLLDYKLSTRMAVLTEQKEILSDLIKRNPQILNYIREHPSDYRIGQYQSMFQTETGCWLEKKLNDEKYDESFEYGDAEKCNAR